MFEVFQTVKKLLKTSVIEIDNPIFRLHYKLTSTIMFVASILLTLKQFLGDPIECTANGVPAQIFEYHCWTQNTFTIPGETGIGTPKPSDELKFHTYYRWVCFMLSFQGLFFMMPHYLWKTWERGTLASLLQRIKGGQANVDNEKELEKIVRHIGLKKGWNSFYPMKFFACELLNTVIVMFQILITDYFLGYEFGTYGFRAIKDSLKDQQDRTDPLIRVFPSMTKCSFPTYGPSGSVQYIDGLCVLPMNSVNEKIYIVLWVWFVVLIGLNAIALAYRFFVSLMPSLRVSIMYKLVAHSITREQCETLLQDTSLTPIQNYGEWFLLYMILKNLDDVAIHDLVQMLLRKKEPRTPTIQIEH